jgi:transcriptional regulator with PAS, ATPase and Fis domain
MINSSKRDEVIYYTYLGELQYRAGRLDESQTTLEKALHMAEEIAPNTTLAGRVMRHLAELAIRLRNHRLAQRYVAKAIPIFQKGDDKVESGALMKLKAQIAEMADQKEEAVAAFKRALDLLAESGVRWEKAEALVAAGCSTAFSPRERMTYLFRAEEFYARCHMVRKHEEIGRLIHEQDDRIDLPVVDRVSASAAEVDYITSCEQIKQFMSQIPILGRSDLPILLTGETGVGKDHLARYYHSVVRPGSRYLAVNCASIPETLLESELFGYRKGAFTGASAHKDGLFVAANGGVLLLDEIGDMPLSLQAKLLSVLERRRVTPLGGTHEIVLDVKILVATNRDLESMVEQGTFRRDLYYRLAGLSFRIPPLRERKEDIPLLLQTFMCKRNMSLPDQKLPAELVRQFLEYEWPGNIRELDNKVKKLEVMAQMVVEGDLVELARSMFAPAKQGPGRGNLFDRVEEYERQLIMEALMAAHGNKCEAARLLGVHEATVRMKLKRYGTSPASPLN